MNINQLKSLSELAQNYGVKCLLYGGPGTAKTPMVATCPRPVVCVVEAGLVSARGLTNIYGAKVGTGAEIIDFFKWACESHEASNFDTICIDSVSQLAEVFLEDELNGKANSGKKVHGMQAYGNMAKQVMHLLNKLYYLPQKHVYITAKQKITDENGVFDKKPHFPGQVLPVDVPHLFDELFHVGLNNVPGQGEILAIRTKATFGITTPRDRSGKLNELEPTDLGAIFSKCMS